MFRPETGLPTRVTYTGYDETAIQVLGTDLTCVNLNPQRFFAGNIKLEIDK